MAMADAGSLCWRCRGAGGAPGALEEQAWGVARRVRCPGAPRAEVERRRGPQNGRCSPGGGPWVPGPGAGCCGTDLGPGHPGRGEPEGCGGPQDAGGQHGHRGEGYRARLAGIPPPHPSWRPRGWFCDLSLCLGFLTCKWAVPALSRGPPSSAWCRRAPRGCSLATHRLPWRKAALAEGWGPAPASTLRCE